MVLNRLLLKSVSNKPIRFLILVNSLLTIKNSVFIFYMVTYLLVTERKTEFTNNFFFDNVIDILLTQKCTNIKSFKVEKNSFFDVVIMCNVTSNTQMVSSVKN